MGYIDGREVSRHERHTPGEAASLKLRFDLGGQPFGKSGKDTVFCHAELRDAAGTIVPNVEVPIFFGATGGNQLVGHNPIFSEAGIATILLQGAEANASVHALCLIRTNGTTRILSAAAAVSGAPAPKHTIRYTTDGTEPTASSRSYEGPIAGTERIRAALFIDGGRIVLADFRINAPSTRPAIVQTASGGRGAGR